ncbi:MAG: PorP/SprF family type IX secretion system membrane protein [Bacteroidetes bacterium]|nr:PorP/SprF family type IX secretion system membrane protein [Bacteroidota bacterium]
MRGHLLALFFCLGLVSAYSQDITNQAQFFFNPYTLNPSYAGTEGRPAFFLSYRKQWANINGAPTIGNFSFHTTTKMKLNYGVNFNSDDRGIVNTSSAMVTVGYTLALNADTWLRFGLSGGVGFNGVDVTKLGNFTDKILPSILNRNSFLMGNAGVSVHHKTFHGGISLPNLFQPVYVSADPFTVSSLSPFQSTIIHVSNRFYFDKDKNIFEPYLLYRLNGSGIPSQFEFAGLLHLQHFVWVGASYRQNFGISGLGGIKVKNTFAVGFSYSIANSGANQLSSPSYEIQLAYLTGFKKKDNLSYSFISTEKEKSRKKSPAQLAAERKQKDAELAKKEQEQKKAQQQAAAKKAEEEKAKALAAQQATKKVLPKETRPDTTHVEDMKVIQRLEQHAEDPNKEHGLASEQHDNHERHETVKRGGHQEELPTSDYVIVGAFGKRENAEHYAASLRKMGFTADFGYLTGHTRWYVYLFEGDDINKARTERDKYRKLSIFRDAWLLTVTE